MSGKVENEAVQPLSSIVTPVDESLEEIENKARSDLHEALEIGMKRSVPDNKSVVKDKNHLTISPPRKRAALDEELLMGGYSDDESEEE